MFKPSWVCLSCLICSWDTLFFSCDFSSPAKSFIPMHLLLLLLMSNPTLAPLALSKAERRSRNSRLGHFSRWHCRHAFVFHPLKNTWKCCCYTQWLLCFSPTLQYTYIFLLLQLQEMCVTPRYYLTQKKRWINTLKEVFAKTMISFIEAQLGRCESVALLYFSFSITHTSQKDRLTPAVVTHMLLAKMLRQWTTVKVLEHYIIKISWHVRNELS